MKKLPILIILTIIAMGIKGYIDRPVFSDKPTVLIFIDPDKDISENSQKIISAFRNNLSFDLIVHSANPDKNKTVSLLQLQIYRYPISAIITTGNTAKDILPITSKNELLTLNTHPVDLDKNTTVQPYINFYPTTSEEIQFLAKYTKSAYRQIIVFYPQDNPDFYQRFKESYTDKKNKIIQTEAYTTSAKGNQGLIKHALYYHPKAIVVLGDKGQIASILSLLNQSEYNGIILTLSSVFTPNLSQKYPYLSKKIIFPLLSGQFKNSKMPLEFGLEEYISILNFLSSTQTEITKENILSLLPNRQLNIFTIDDKNAILLPNETPQQLDMNKRN